MNSGFRLLILDDNPADAELAEYTLKSAGISFISRVVETREEYRSALKEFSPDIILSDYDLPLFNGAEAQKTAREVCPDVPFILFTGAMGEERAIEILTGGATDYVMKNRLSRLVPAVERALKEAGEHQRRKKAETERDLLLNSLEARVQERTAELQAEIAVRRRVEEALRDNEAKFRDLFEKTEREKNYIQAILQALPVGLAIVDIKGGTVLSNAEYEKIWGGPRPATLEVADYTAYKAWWSDGKLVEPEEWASSLALAKGETVMGQQMEIQRFDGRRAFVLNSAAPVHDGSGGITGAVVTIMDVSEQKLAEYEVRASERRIRGFFKSDMIGTACWNVEGKITGANDKFLDMIGYTREELRAGLINWMNITPAEYRERDEHAIRELKSTGVNTPFEKEYIRKDGSRIPVIIGGSFDEHLQEGFAFILDNSDRTVC
ncbi:MAG: PAS domain S-box protein [Syntrophaceae bacterium]